VRVNDLSSHSLMFRFHYQQGGGSTNIFAPAEEAKPHARPKYDQQNSSNLNFCMNTVDPNVKVQQHQVSEEPEAPAPASAPASEPQQSAAAVQQAAPTEPAQPSAPLPQYHHHRSTALW
jgi:hypothetical protein